MKFPHTYLLWLPRLLEPAAASVCECLCVAFCPFSSSTPTHTDTHLIMNNLQAGQIRAYSHRAKHSAANFSASLNARNLVTCIRRKYLGAHNVQLSRCLRVQSSFFIQITLDVAFSAEKYVRMCVLPDNAYTERSMYFIEASSDRTCIQKGISWFSRHWRVCNSFAYAMPAIVMSMQMLLWMKNIGCVVWSK